MCIYILYKSYAGKEKPQKGNVGMFTHGCTGMQETMMILIPNRNPSPSPDPGPNASPTRSPSLTA